MLPLMVCGSTSGTAKPSHAVTNTQPRGSSPPSCTSVPTSTRLSHVEEDQKKSGTKPIITQLLLATTLLSSAADVTVLHLFALPPSPPPLSIGR